MFEFCGFRATILPALERILPVQWNDSVITLRLPYWKSKSSPLFQMDIKVQILYDILQRPCLDTVECSNNFVGSECSDVEVEFTKSQLVAGIPGTLFCVWYVMKKHWLANNTLGLAFSIQVLLSTMAWLIVHPIFLIS